MGCAGKTSLMTIDLEWSEEEEEGGKERRQENINRAWLLGAWRRTRIAQAGIQRSEAFIYSTSLGWTEHLEHTVRFLPFSQALLLLSQAL